MWFSPKALFTSGMHMHHAILSMLMIFVPCRFKFFVNPQQACITVTILQKHAPVKVWYFIYSVYVSFEKKTQTRVRSLLIFNGSKFFYTYTCTLLLKISKVSLLSARGDRISTVFSLTECSHLTQSSQG